MPISLHHGGIMHTSKHIQELCMALHTRSMPTCVANWLEIRLLTEFCIKCQSSYNCKCVGDMQ